MLSLISISLAACSSAGNVVPKQGPTMEQVYDGMEHDEASRAQDKGDDLKVARQKIAQNIPPTMSLGNTLCRVNSTSKTFESFRQVPNPLLKFYIYPHLASDDELPVPGYVTEFSGYEKNFLM